MSYANSPTYGQTFGVPLPPPTTYGATNPMHKQPGGGGGISGSEGQLVLRMTGAEMEVIRGPKHAVAVGRGGASGEAAADEKADASSQSACGSGMSTGKIIAIVLAFVAVAAIAGGVGGALGGKKDSSSSTNTPVAYITPFIVEFNLQNTPLTDSSTTSIRCSLSTAAAIPVGQVSLVSWSDSSKNVYSVSPSDPINKGVCSIRRLEEDVSKIIARMLPVSISQAVAAKFEVLVEKTKVVSSMESIGAATFSVPVSVLSVAFPSPTPSPTPSLTPTQTPSSTNTPAPEASPSPTPSTNNPDPEASPSPTPSTNNPDPEASPSPTPSTNNPDPEASPSPTPSTNNPDPEASPSPTPSTNNPNPEASPSPTPSTSTQAVESEVSPTSSVTQTPDPNVSPSPTPDSPTATTSPPGAGSSASPTPSTSKAAAGDTSATPSPTKSVTSTVTVSPSCTPPVAASQSVPVASLLKNINSGVAGSFPTNFVSFNNKVCFSASDGQDGNNDQELFCSDGTAAGTTKVKNINNGGGSNPKYLTVMGSKLYFSAVDASSFPTAFLYSTDGTSAGTTLVKDVNNPTDLIVFSGKLFFSGVDSSNNDCELWISDGTSPGTAVLKNIAAGAISSYPRDFTLFNSKLYFTASTSIREVWSTDGTADGTLPIMPPDAMDYAVSPYGLRVVGTNLYFFAHDSTVNNELRVTTGSGQTLVKDLNKEDPGDSFGIVGRAFNGKYYFVANKGNNFFTNDKGLYSTDGTEAGTVLVKSEASFAYSVVFKNQLWWVHGNYLFFSDGTAAGTQQFGKNFITDPYPGSSDRMPSNPANLAVFGDKLYFTVTTAPIGNELWCTDGTVAGTKLVKDINPGQDSEIPGPLVVVNNKMYFQANDGSVGAEVWVVTF